MFLSALADPTHPDVLAELRAGALSPSTYLALFGCYPPIGGAEDPPVDDPPADPPVDDPPADPPVDDPPVDDPPADPPADPPEPSGLSKAEAEALRRKVAESEKRQRAAERAVAAAQQREKKRQGEFEGLYEEEKTKRIELEGTVKKKALRAAIRDIAGRLNFRNAAVAVDLIMPKLNPEEIVDEDLEVDEARVEDALTALAKSDTYLVRPKVPQKDPPARKPTPGGAPPESDDDPAHWNPAATMRGAYANASGGG